MHPHAYRLMMGRAPLYAPNDDSGHEPAPAEPVIEVAMATSVEPPVAPAPVPPVAPPISDESAKLLKDTMKHKAAAAAAQAELAAANARLAAFDGIDPVEARRVQAAQADAELSAAEARGEYASIITQMREQQAAAIDLANTRNAEAAAALTAAQVRIDDLTIGQSFSSSEFLSKNTLLSPAKARKFYGDHFDIVDGENVPYDKPRGERNRNPLVDAHGDYLGFEAAIEKIVKADPDFEVIGRSKIRPGSGSSPSTGTTVEAPAAKLSGRDLIAAALSRSKKAK